MTFGGDSALEGVARDTLLPLLGKNPSPADVEQWASGFRFRMMEERRNWWDTIRKLLDGEIEQVSPTAISTFTPSSDNHLVTKSFASTLITTALPVGAVMLWPNAAPPTGWALCDGSAVSRTTYAALFAICGISYGAGNTTTTFNLPDGRLRFPLYTTPGASDGVAYGSRTPTTHQPTLATKGSGTVYTSQAQDSIMDHGTLQITIGTYASPPFNLPRVAAGDDYMAMFPGAMHSISGHAHEVTFDNIDGITQIAQMTNWPCSLGFSFIIKYA